MEVATSHEEKPNMVQEGGVQGRDGGQGGEKMVRLSPKQLLRVQLGYISQGAWGKEWVIPVATACFILAHCRQYDIDTNAHNHNEEDSFVYNCIDSRIIHWHVVSIVDDLQNHIPKRRCNNVFASASTNIPQKFHNNHRGCIVTGEQ
jgi:hypothetical protein